MQVNGALWKVMQQHDISKVELKVIFGISSPGYIIDILHNRKPLLPKHIKALTDTYKISASLIKELESQANPYFMFKVRPEQVDKRKVLEILKKRENFFAWDEILKLLEE